MLDINLLRNDLPKVVAGLARRGVTLDAARFEALERDRKDIQTRTQQLQAQAQCAVERDRRGEGQGEDAAALLAEVAGIGDETKRLEGDLDGVQTKLRDFLLELPNLAASSVPAGRSSDDNVEVRRWGTPKTFDFPVRDHTDLGESLGMLDFATAAKLSGARFTFLRGGLAQAAPRARPIHARHADDGARLHRVLHAVHRERRGARGHDAAAEVRGRHVLGAQGRRCRGRSGGGRAAIPDLDVRDHADEFRARRDPPGRGAAAQADGALAVLPLGGGKLRQGHARDDPPAPVRQGGDGAGRASGQVLRRARGD